VSEKRKIGIPKRESLEGRSGGKASNKGGGVVLAKRKSKGGVGGQGWAGKKGGRPLWL